MFDPVEGEESVDLCLGVWADEENRLPEISYPIPVEESRVPVWLSIRTRGISVKNR